MLVLFCFVFVTGVVFEIFNNFAHIYIFHIYITQSLQGKTQN